VTAPVLPLYKNEKPKVFMKNPHIPRSDQQTQDLNPRSGNAGLHPSDDGVHNILQFRKMNGFLQMIVLQIPGNWLF